MEQDRKPRNKPTCLWQLIFNKGGKNKYNGEKITSSTSGVGKAGQSHVNQ